MKTNAPAVNRARTYEGAAALPAEKPSTELRRAVLSCLLFENTFYEKGSALASRIQSLAAQTPAGEVAALAIEARREHGLRHVSLFLALTLIGRAGADAATTIAEVVQRPDELAETLSLYWRTARKPLAASLKRGLARAFCKFTAHRFAKYDRDDAVKLRDVMFLVHPKPKDDEQAAVFKAIASRTLAIPDTWEVALSAGGDKRETWSRLIAENKLGGLAFVRNIRNMEQAGVPREDVKRGLAMVDARGVFPWQIIGAAQHAPWAEPELEMLMFRSVGERRLPGLTTLLIDVSGSMDDALSAKGERRRIDAACALAMVARETCESVRVLTFSSALVEVPARRGFALAEAIARSQPHSATYLGQALAAMKHESTRLIVITDEQTHDEPGTVAADRAYIVNVGPYKPALMVSGKWRRIAGWSDRLLDWIVADER